MSTSSRGVKSTRQSSLRAEYSNRFSVNPADFAETSLPSSVMLSPPCLTIQMKSNRLSHGCS